MSFVVMFHDKKRAVRSVSVLKEGVVLGGEGRCGAWGRGDREGDEGEGEGGGEGGPRGARKVRAMSATKGRGRCQRRREGRCQRGKETKGDDNGGVDGYGEEKSDA